MPSIGIKKKYEKWIAVILLGLFVVALAFGIRTMLRAPGVLWRSQALGLLATAAIVAAWIRHRSMVSPVALFPALILVLYIAYRAMIFRHLSTDAPTYDLYLLAIDRSFGFHLSLWCYKWVDRLGMFGFISIVYETLLCALGLVYALEIRPAGRPGRAFAVLFLTGVLGPLCYRLLPACGPVWLLGSPCYTGELSVRCADVPRDYLLLVRLDSAWPRNAMPSMHLAWALLIWWLCRERKVLRYVGLAFALATAVATLGGGEHYLVDLVGAFPFALIVWTVCDTKVPLSHPKRMLPLTGGACMLLLWIGTIRFWPQIFWSSPLVPWASGMTLVGSTLLTLKRCWPIELQEVHDISGLRSDTTEITEPT